MAWLEITINTAGQGTSSVASTLTAAGFSDLVIEDQNEFEAFLEDNRDYWDYIDEDLQQQLQGLSRVKLYLEDGDKANLARLEELVTQLALTMEVATLPEVDYEESWKDSYPPQPIGQKLIVLPYWLAEQDTAGRLPVILDPGLTFGTGAHPSTQMVMEAMEELVTPDCRCLDLGSGSGILSIAALRLGAAGAVGVDIDPKAEDIARQNAAYNGFAAPEFTALTGNVTADRTLMDRLAQDEYQILLVNIVADVIIGLAPSLPHFMTENTRLICSGILDSRLEDVRKALLAAGIQPLVVKQSEEWRCIIAERRNP
ncbi:MAG: 50S ribosomal protein L11 methyltransferase [Ruminococcaceae bacterium]|nr:50S ribosomal protein L11 methyltransferase [Oscillospiraceae bacterium]MBQ3215328.1 50S ribosomal protein L11 methyltransferase [Oscillospiraceae bacterium]